MAMERFDKRNRIVTRLSLQPTFPDECFNFGLVQLDGYAADALPAPIPKKAHSRGTGAVRQRFIIECHVNSC